MTAFPTPRGLGAFLKLFPFLFSSPVLNIVAVSVPKRRRKIKELNKKEAVGDLLDAFKEVRKQIVAEGRVWVWNSG